MSVLTCIKETTTKTFNSSLSAREIHSTTLDETHVENVASFGSQKNRVVKGVPIRGQQHYDTAIMTLKNP